MRTDEEILARINKIENDFLGFSTSDLVRCLPFEQAKPFLTDSAKEEEWTVEPHDRESLLARMLNYMPFAWGKANNMRGISAARSLSHYQEWIWLAGDDLGDFSDYQYYGKDELVRICEHYGWEHAQWDDGERTNG